MNLNKKKFEMLSVFMDPGNGDENWKILEHAIHQIYNHNASGLNFQQLYRHAYTMIHNDYGDKLYFGLVATMTSHLKEMARSIEGTQGGDSFLEELNSKWNHHHRKSLPIIRDILRYMDRVHIPNVQKTQVYELGLNLCIENVIYSEQIKTRLSNTLLNLICRECAGEDVNRELIRNITMMLMDLSSSIYEQVFETPFLQVSAEFYRTESQKFIDCGDCEKYIKEVERCMYEEMDRVCQYLDPCTEDKIATVVEKEMIANCRLRLSHMDNYELINMFINSCLVEYEDLSRMYMLSDRVTDGLQKIYEMMISFTHQKVL